MKVFCVSMIRNEADIIQYCVDQFKALFNKTYIANIQSSDGTTEILQEFNHNFPDLCELYVCKISEKYQSAITSALIRKAFKDGADWVFLLDADEFLNIPDRQTFVKGLEKHSSGLVRLRWCNLIPSCFGVFDSFQFKQNYYVAQRLSNTSKIAISRRFFIENPYFYLSEGNHEIAKRENGSYEFIPASHELFHLPVRSYERLLYKVTNASKLLSSKHNKRISEGVHLDPILRTITSQGTSPLSEEVLSAIAANYGDPKARILDSKELLKNKSLVRLPSYLDNSVSHINKSFTLQETKARDQNLAWETKKYIPGSRITGMIEKNIIKILPSSIYGAGQLRLEPYKQLEDIDYACDSKLSTKDIFEIIINIFSNINIIEEKNNIFGILFFVLLTVFKPRRVVIAGSFCSNYFLSLCEVNKCLGLESECIAVDDWVNNDQLKHKSNFIQFKSKLSKEYPDQLFIRSDVKNALDWFENSSIDLIVLNINGNASEFMSKVQDKMTNNCIVVINEFNNLGNDIEQQSFLPDYYEGYRCVAFKLDKGHKAVFLCKKNPGYLATMFIDLLEENKIFYNFMLELLKDKNDQGKYHLASLSFLYNHSHKYFYFLIKWLWSILKTSFPYSRQLKELCIRNYKIIRLIGRDVFISCRKLIWNIQRFLKKNFSNSLYFCKFTPKKEKFINFDGVSENKKFTSLNPNIRLVIPTRGCGKWLSLFLDEYERNNLSPLYLVDNTTDNETINILKSRSVDYLFIDQNNIANGESIMPYISKYIAEEYILRIDDDEYPTANLLSFVNYIPESDYSFVTSWWIPRYEIAYIDGALVSCHPKWLKTRVGNKLYENLHGGRFYKHKHVKYGHIGPHHGNFSSDYVSHAPPDALLLHLDCLVRSPSRRLEKIRSVESRFPNHGWPFANHVIPEMAPSTLLRPKIFIGKDLDPFLSRLVDRVYESSGNLQLEVNEIRLIQQDRLSLSSSHFHY